MSQCHHLFLSGATAATLVGGSAATSSLGDTVAGPALAFASGTTAVALTAVAGLVAALPFARAALRRADVRSGQ